MSVGIAKIAPRDTNLQTDENLVIIPASESINFAVYLYGNTKNEQATVKAIKWVWVEEKYLSQLRAMTKENKFEHWGKWSSKEKKPLNLYGIGINYAKSTSINISNLSGSIGKKYWLEAFVLYPEFKHPVGKYFTIKGKPAILSAYFEGAAIGECNDLVKSKYGKTINLIINTHSLPDVTLSYHNYVVFEIDIYNKEKNKKVTKEPFRSYIDFAQGAKDLNGTIKTGIILEDSWRNEVAHNNSDETKSYYAVIKATHYFNKDAVYNGEEIPGSKIGSAFVQKSPNKELVAYTITEEDWRKDNTYLSFLGKSFGDVKAAAAKYQSTEINFKTIDSKGEQLPLYVQLPYTTQGEAIGFRTIEAGKMLAAIKDKKYTCKETHSCKFTAIEVVVGENKDGKKTPTVIFNENDDSTIEVNDNTTKIFSFVAGESKRETLEITLKDLSITDFGNDDGEIKCIAPVPHTKKNLIDATKVSPQWLVEKGSATDKKYSTYEVKKNAILLDMGYHYNTKVAERSGINNKLLDKLWMFNYFLLSKKNAQDYVVPINTCRYPSQRVLLQVFPNITWGISFSVGKIDPKYKEDWRSDLTETRKKTLDEVKAFGEMAKPDFLKKKEQAIRKLNLKLGINVAYDNIKFDFAPDFGQKIHDVVYAFAKAKELMDVMTGNEHDDKTKKLKYQERIKKLAKKRGSKWLSKLSKLPITIEVSEPALSFGGTWGFQPNQLDATNVLPSYNIFLKAAPLLKASGKLDLITCAGFIPVAGQVIKVADIILDAAGAEVSFFIEVVGSIDVGVAFTMQVAAQAQLSKGDVGFDGALKLRVEASLTLGGGLVGFLFMGGDISGSNTTKYVASAETGFTGGLKIGADNTGLYLNTTVKFAGLSAVAQKVQGNKGVGGGRTKTLGPYVIAKERTLLENKHYFNLQQNDKN